MVEGRYRDVVLDARHRVMWDLGWRGNMIVQAAWRVVAALLRNDASMRGLLFCAVGTGDDSWDAAPPVASPGTTRLRAECERQALLSGDVVYLDARGAAAPQPTDRLEVAARFAVNRPLGLREFGLFAGDATAAPDSGYLFNYAVHPRLQLRAGSTLTRRVRFTLRPGPGGHADDWLTLPAHWLSKESPRLLDGVGDAYAETLAGAAIKTIGALAVADPVKLGAAVPAAKLVELRARARLAIRTAAALQLVPALAGYTAWRVISTPAKTLADEAEAPTVVVETLREQLAALQLALDARYVKRVTVGELARRS